MSKNNFDEIKVIITSKLLKLNDLLVQYNILLDAGLSKDNTFEKIIVAKKETLEEILLILK